MKNLSFETLDGVSLKVLIEKEKELVKFLDDNPEAKNTPIGRNAQQMILNVAYIVKAHLNYALAGITGVES